MSDLIITQSEVPTTKPPLSKNWKVTVNAEYQKIATTIINLTTASLVLPLVFLKDVVGRQPKAEGAGLLHDLKWQAYVAWGCLLVAIFFGLVFYLASTRFVKCIERDDPKWEKFFEVSRDFSAGSARRFFLWRIDFHVLLFLYLRGVIGHLCKTQDIWNKPSALARLGFPVPKFSSRVRAASRRRHEG